MRTAGLVATCALVLGACAPTLSPFDDGRTPDTGPADPGPADPGSGDPGPAPDAEDPGPAPVDPSCRPCDQDAECGAGARCLPIGASKHCVTDCDENRDCRSGYICYAASASGKACLPVSYHCAPCIAESPCGFGDCCDFVTGACKACRGACVYCTWDFECDAGLRCYRDGDAATGVCVPECGKAACPDADRFQCRQADKGVPLCVPVAPGCGQCPTGRFPSDDGTACWECRGDGDCKSPDRPYCAPDHACSDDPCLPLRNCGSRDAPTCRQCCVDEDCGHCVQPGTCNVEGLCTNGRVDTCGGACEMPFPECVIIGGQPQCVQCNPWCDRCADQSPGCTCDPDTFTCTDGEACPDGGSGGCAGVPDEPVAAWFASVPPPMSSCSAICTSDADCPPLADGSPTSCSAASPYGGFCFAPAGTCDGLFACCAVGQCCMDAVGQVLWSVLGPGVPSVGSTGRCSCDDGHPCLGGAPCTDVATLCDRPDLAGVCPDGELLPGLRMRLCGTPDAIARQLRPAVRLATCPAECTQDADCGGPVGSVALCVHEEGLPGRCLDAGNRCGPGLCCLGGDCVDLARGFLCPGGPCTDSIPQGLAVCACDDLNACIRTECADLAEVCTLAPALCPGGVLPPGLPAKACVDVDALVAALLPPGP